MNLPTDPPITLTLSLSAWGVVWEHVGRGAYTAVAAIMSEMASQACPQVEAANRAVIEQAAAAETQKLAEISQPAPTVN